MVTAYIGIGSNVGDRKKNIDDAITRINSSVDIDVVKVSSVRETEPVGGPPQDRYLNCVIEIKTKLAPFELLKFLNKIENDLGRIRIEKNGPRTIDLDILIYDNVRMNADDLVIPHPRMRERKFVLDALYEIAPHLTAGFVKFRDR